jgi:hypothetical protein
LKPNRLAGEIRDLVSASSSEKWHKKELDRIKSLFINKIKDLTPLNQETMYEGGKFIRILSEALLREEYLKITDEIFNQVSF